MGWTGREDREFAPFRRFVVLLPMELGSRLLHVIAIQDPSQNTVNRLGGLITDRPIAMPTLKTLTRRVMLQVEDWINEQRLFGAAIAKQGAFLQITLQPSGHTPQN